MLLLTLLIVSVPILLAGYEVKTKAEEALIAEKQAKLFFAARLLDSHLAQGGFAAILQENNSQTDSRDVQLHFLNQALSPYTDAVAAAMPGLGVGYYSRELDAIITYGPSREYAATVGRSIRQDHPGRKVMSEGAPRVEFGSLVRGNIMNAMLPIVRSGKVEGYIWANELTDDIRSQMASMNRQIYLFGVLGLLVCLGLMVILTNRFVSDVETIKHGLDRMRSDLTRPLPGMTGEMGEIATAINRMSREIQEACLLNENILFSIADGIITVDSEGRIVMINQAAQAMTGYVAEEIIGRLYNEIFVSGEKEFRSMLLDTLETGVSHIGIELDYPTRNGYRRISVSSSRLQGGSSENIGAVVVMRDLTEKQQLQQNAMQSSLLAAMDSMTGIMNRRAFLEKLETMLEQAQSERLEFSLAFLDLDHLKSVNDNFGHQEGDWYIRSVASLISRFVRENDSAGRLGGDEFALIFPGYSSEQAEMVLRQIEKGLSELTETMVKPYRLGFSFGVVFVGAGTYAKAEELLNQADTLMYQHKKLRHLNK
jgi:two-component system sensor histidine kinase AtoS